MTTISDTSLSFSMAPRFNPKFLLTYVMLISALCVSSIFADECRYQIVESMPDLMTFNNSISFQPQPTHEALIEMIEKCKTSLKVASFYWTLSADTELQKHPSTLAGRRIMDSIVAAVGRGVSLEVILDDSAKKSMSNQDDVKKLKSIGTVRFLNMTKLLKAGVCHTKFMIADDDSLYLGSSNFDWRSYTQIKEIGIRFDSCKVIVDDLNKVFETYKLISGMDQVPASLPDAVKTEINIDNPLNITLGDLKAKLFLAASPPAFNGLKEWTGRTDDIDGLLKIINKAHKHVDISVMNYSPRTEFTWPKRFWPRIDDALRRAAAERRVRVRLLFSDWDHTKPEEVMWYKSLNAVQSEALRGGGIHVKMFRVPAYDDFQKTLPYARVKHDKYMVTDNGLYIGTSNWAPDYFINTCGVSVVIEPVDRIFSNRSIISDMQDLFERDFSSEHSREL